ncbi:MAG TPA: alpha/beta hydrolase [Thermomicrobiales bacterium]|nr:alpha/beta hydrolase [Thermomicrobiales bacterium]
MSESRNDFEPVNGVRLAYRHWPGPSNARRPPVVLLHGVLQSGEGMRHLAEQLSLDREVLVPDLRGRGKSDRPVDSYDPATMADDVAELIDRLGIERPALIGRLHGGLVAYHLAARRPELVSGVVLGDANPEVTADRAAQALAAVNLLPGAFASHEDATRFYEQGLGLPPDRARHDIPSDLEATPGGGYRWRHDLDIVRRIESAAVPRSDWDVLARVRCQTLILRGQRGEIRQETADRMLSTIPRARVQTIYGASHDVFLGPGSEQTLAAIQLFLFGLDGES